MSENYQTEDGNAQGDDSPFSYEVKDEKGERKHSQ
jgi:hypothetical protein